MKGDQVEQWVTFPASVGLVEPLSPVTTSAFLPFSCSLWTMLTCSWNSQAKVDQLAEWWAVTQAKRSIKLFNLSLWIWQNALSLSRIEHGIFSWMQTIDTNVSSVYIYTDNSLRMVQAVYPLIPLSQHSDVSSYDTWNYYICHLQKQKQTPSKTKLGGTNYRAEGCYQDIFQPTWTWTSSFKLFL